MYLASNLFSKAYDYSVKNYRSVAILSAKYGLLLPNEKIEPYDLTLKKMGASGRRRWAKKTFSQMKNKLPLKDIVDKIYFHAGKEYREFLTPQLEESGVSYEIPLEGLRIGEQMAWYNNHL
jgi:hypothetical protein